MAVLAHSWAVYSRLQEELLSCKHISDRTWGVEDALDQILNAQNQLTYVEIERIIAAGERRARHRTRLRSIYLQDDEEEFSDQLRTLAARQALRLLLNHANTDDMSLLCAVAEGQEYRDLTTEFQSSIGTLRTRVSRLRCTFGYLVAN